MVMKILTLAVVVALAALPVQAQQRQSGGCASGFCSVSNAPQQEAAADIDQVEADMKRQMAQGGQSQPQAQPGMGRGGMGMMNMCPCMRMMAMMRQGGMGMGGMNMGGMNMGGMGMGGMGGMQDMPGMSMPKPDEKKAPAQ